MAHTRETCDKADAAGGMIGLPQVELRQNQQDGQACRKRQFPKGFQ
jgi:hypothetical protein